PPATLGNYLWDLMVFAILGALIGPVVTWQNLRNAPLWRTIVEPALGGVLGAILAALLGSGVLLLILAPLGVGAAVARLSYAYDDTRRLPPRTDPPSSPQSPRP